MKQELQNLLKVGGEIAEYLKLLSYEQKEEIAFVQAVYATLKEKGALPEGRVIQSAAEADQLSREHNLERGLLLKRAHQYIETPPSPNEAPLFMTIAKQIGALPATKSNPLLAAQAGARMADSAEKLRTGDFGDKPPMSLEEALKANAFLNDKEKIKGDPAYLTAAQATDHLAKIFTAGLIEKNDPSLLQDSDVKRAIQAFQLYASQTIKRAGNEMEAAGVPAAGDIIRKSRDSLHGFDKVNPFSELANTTALTNDIHRGFKKLGFSAEIQALIDSRLEQSRGMQHKGIAISPFTRGTATIESSWLERVQASRNQGGHQHGM